MDTIRVRLYDTLGCTVVATVLLQSLREKFPSAKINVYTAYPDLLAGLREIDGMYDSNAYPSEDYNIDLTGYLEIRKPQESKPFRHLAVHMLEMAEEQLGDRITGALKRDFLPVVDLTQQEEQNAREIVQSLSRGKPVVWLQTKTRQPKKDWPREHWEN